MFSIFRLIFEIFHFERWTSIPRVCLATIARKSLKNANVKLIHDQIHKCVKIEKKKTFNLETVLLNIIIDIKKCLNGTAYLNSRYSGSRGLPCAGNSVKLKKEKKYSSWLIGHVQLNINNYWFECH